jgi:hypothetical protein
VTLFGFWDTGQAELWEAGFLVASFALLVGPEPSSERLFAAGALACIAALFKITAAIPTVALGVMSVARCYSNSHPRGLRTAIRTVSMFSLGWCFPLLATVGYFRARGGFSALREWIFSVPHYAAAPLDPNWVASVGPEMLLARCGYWFGVFAVLCMIGLSEARLSPAAFAARPALWAAVLLGTGFLSVVVQRRYFSYHAVAVGPLLALSAAYGVGPLLRERRTLTTLSVLFLTAGSFFSAPSWTGNEGTTYRSFVFHAWWPRVTGRLSDEAYAAVFEGPFGYSYVEHESLATLISSQKPRPGDRLHVRGYGTTIYVLTGLRSPSRFLMESPLQDSYLLSYEPEWAEEHSRILLVDRPPRFFVTQVGAADDIELLKKAGYGLVGSRGRYLLLELAVGASPLDATRLNSVVAGNTFRGTALGGLKIAVNFGLDGRLQAQIQDESRSGVWRISEDAEVCVDWGDTVEKCATVYERGQRYVAFDETGQELADLTPSPGAI